MVELCRDAATNVGCTAIFSATDDSDRPNVSTFKIALGRGVPVGHSYLFPGGVRTAD